MIKVWIIILTTAMPPNVPSMTQEFRVFDEGACREMERPASVLANGLYWSARCESRLITKPKETK